MYLPTLTAYLQSLYRPELDSCPATPRKGVEKLDIKKHAEVLSLHTVGNEKLNIPPTSRR